MTPARKQVDSADNGWRAPMVPDVSYLPSAQYRRFPIVPIDLLPVSCDMPAAGRRGHLSLGLRQRLLPLGLRRP